MDVHYQTHVFIKIKIPLPPLSNSKQAVLQPLYPGNEFSVGQYHYDFTQLRKETHFDEIELQATYHQFRSLSTVDLPEGGINNETFLKCLGPLGIEKNLICERIFAFFDQDRNGIISFEELVRGLSILCKGSLDERIRYAFEGYDLNGDGLISRDELRQMFKAYFNTSMAMVRDVVKKMEEDMMASFDDEDAKPVSSTFAAPIDSSGGPESSSEGENNDGGEENGDVDDDDGFGPRQDTVMTSGIRRNRPRAAGPRRPRPRKVVELLEEEDTFMDASETLEEGADHFSTALSSDSNHSAPVSTRTISRERVLSSPEPAFVDDAIQHSPLSSLSHPPLPPQIGMFRLSSHEGSSSIAPLAMPASSTEATPTSASLPPLPLPPSNLSPVNTMPTATHTTTGVFPIMEAMSQEAIEEMVQRTFAAVGASDREHIDFDDFKRVVEYDVNMLAWFEALGSVF
eukprot:jgi/Hompol1/4868/HPOL_003958-RA